MSELKWECDSCSTVNLGRLTVCFFCGSENAVKDINLLKILSGCENKYCLDCGASNRIKSSNCDKCGSDISVNFSEEPVANSPVSSSIIQGSFRAENSATTARSSNGDRGIAPKTEHATGGGKQPSKGYPGATGEKTLSLSDSPTSWFSAHLLIIISGIACFAGIKIFVPIDYNAEIIGRHWHRTVDVEKWYDYKVKKKKINTTESIGQLGVPGFSMIPDTCAQEIEKYIDVPCETHKGYCKEAVYSEYCEYISQNWVHDYSATLDEVNSNELFWPKIKILDNQRIKTYEYYAFDISFDGVKRSLVIDFDVYSRYRDKNNIRIRFTYATSEMQIVEPESNDK